MGPVHYAVTWAFLEPDGAPYPLFTSLTHASELLLEVTGTPYPLFTPLTLLASEVLLEATGTPYPHPLLTDVYICLSCC